MEEPSAMEIDGDDVVAKQKPQQPGDNNSNSNNEDFELDCYPYTFSPLLLFSESSYFDKGHSNYNSVHQFFSSGGVLPDDVAQTMATNVLFERKNMLYEDLLEYVTRNEMLVTCCIDDHFTAFQVLEAGRGRPCLVYYDPTSPHLQLVTDKDGYQKLALYLLLKCNYGDSQHIQENKGHYVTTDASTLLSSATLKPKQQQLRKTIYQLWKNIHQISGVHNIRGIAFQSVPLRLDRYLLFNHPQNPSRMSTQLTSNTCYFQTYWFAILCYCGKLRVQHSATSGFCLEVEHVERLEQTAVAMSRFLLEFFVQATTTSSAGSRKTTMPNSHKHNNGEDVDSLLADLDDLEDHDDDHNDNGSNHNGNGNGNDNSTPPKRRILRPLTNSNFIVDFYRYKQAPYYATVTSFLKQYYASQSKQALSPSPKQQQQPYHVLPNYESQFHQILQYYQDTKCLHKYDKFSLDGPMSSTLNTKSLQLVTSCDSGGSAGGAVRQLARSDYYKYRAANFMFGFNAGIVGHLESFCDFNAWRKNQLLRYCGDAAEVYDTGTGSNGSDKNDDTNDDEEDEAAREPRPSIQPYVSGIVKALSHAKGTTKYRDYCEFCVCYGLHCFVMDCPAGQRLILSCACIILCASMCAHLSPFRLHMSSILGNPCIHQPIQTLTSQTLCHSSRLASNS